MQINTDALISLQIFLNEKHASVYSNVVKEGLSIYGKQTPYHSFIDATLILQRDLESNSYAFRSHSHAPVAAPT